MQTTGARPENMPRDECLRLLATTSIGRIIYTRHALPAVELVTFGLESGDIVARTMLEPLKAAVRDSVVAFEAAELAGAISQVEQAAATPAVWCADTIYPASQAPSARGHSLGEAHCLRRHEGPDSG